MVRTLQPAALCFDVLHSRTCSFQSGGTLPDDEGMLKSCIHLLSNQSLGLIIVYDLYNVCTACAVCLEIPSLRRLVRIRRITIDVTPTQFRSWGTEWKAMQNRTDKSSKRVMNQPHQDRPSERCLLGRTVLFTHWYKLLTAVNNCAREYKPIHLRTKCQLSI